MNYQKRIERMEDQLKGIMQHAEVFASDLRNIQETMEKAEYTTAQFLDRCKAHGIACVSIGMRTERIPFSVTFPFSAEGHVFGEGMEPESEDSPRSTPSIWAAAKEAGLSTGCGNQASQQVNDRFLIDGVYECRNGQWQKIQ